MNKTLVEKAHGWLEPLPAGWCTVPLKYLCEVNPESLSENTDGSFCFDYVDISSVNLNDGIVSTENMRFDEAPSRARRVVQAGDVLMSTVRTYLKAIAVVPSRNNPTVVSTGFLVLRACEDVIDSGYLGYAIKSDSFVSAIEMESVGVSYPAINASDAVRNYIPVPPLKIQRGITSYLDARCAPIDEAIARHRTAIGKLEEYRRAVITKAVTKGLNPNADMKDSGYEWMGDVPVQWSTKRLKFVATRVFDGPFGSHLKNDDYTDAGIRVVRLENLKYLKFDNSKRSYVTEAKYDTIRRHTVFPSDLIMATFVNGEVDVCRLPAECSYAVNKADCVGIRLKSGYVPEFMQYALSANTTYTYLKSLMHGATRGRVNTTQIKSIPIAIPTAEEQLDIVAHLDYQCAAVDDSIDRQNQIINKLEEYRKSLIHAAVTGRIDCTEGAGE